MSRIEAKVEKTDKTCKEPTNELAELIVAWEGKSRINSFVAQSLLIDFGINEKPFINWHFEYFMWSHLVKLRISELNRLALWCHYAPYENGHGLGNAALFYHNKSLDDLNTEELMKIIIISRAPSLYAKYPSKIEEKANALKQKLRKGR
jgi:hypothetical protein